MNITYFTGNISVSKVLKYPLINVIRELILFVIIVFILNRSVLIIYLSLLLFDLTLFIVKLSILITFFIRIFILIFEYCKRSLLIRTVIVLYWYTRSII